MHGESILLAFITTAAGSYHKHTIAEGPRSATIPHAERRCAGY